MVNGCLYLRRRHLLRSPYLLWRRYSGGPDGELDLLLGYALPVHGIAATHVGDGTGHLNDFTAVTNVYD